jgi:hypothetical protein
VEAWRALSPAWLVPQPVARSWPWQPRRPQEFPLQNHAFAWPSPPVDFTHQAMRLKAAADVGQMTIAIPARSCGASNLALIPHGFERDYDATANS